MPYSEQQWTTSRSDGASTCKVTSTRQMASSDTSAKPQHGWADIPGSQIVPTMDLLFRGMEMVDHGDREGVYKRAGRWMRNTSTGE